MPSSSRILYDVPCGVCKDNSSGKHYGVFACDGCAGFFKRSVRRERNYICKARVPGTCIIDKIHRNQCRSCRLAKCIDAGMNKDAVQHERGPRNSTIRRQMEMFAKDPVIPTPPRIYPANTIPEPSLAPPTMPRTLPLYPNPFAHFNRLNLFGPPNIYSPPRFYSPLLFTNNLGHNNDPERLCESAARVLFLNVKWIKGILPFESFSLPERLLLIEESWTELFVLGVAQCIFPLDLNSMLIRHARIRLDRPYVDAFASVLNEINSLRLDEEEYGYLRLLVLFKTHFSGDDFVRRSVMNQSQPRTLPYLPAAAEMQFRIQTALNIHLIKVHPRDFGRASQLLQILTRLKTIPALTIIELFFRNTIGDITIERIITDMYKSGRIPEVPFHF